MKPYKIKVKQADRQDQILCLSLKMKGNLLKKDIWEKTNNLLVVCRVVKEYLFGTEMIGRLSDSMMEIPIGL